MPPPAIWRGPPPGNENPNWSSLGNWSGNRPVDGAPVVFDLAGSDPTGRVTDVVDQSITIPSLTFRSPDGTHTTQIPENVTLTIQGGRGLTVGTAGDPREPVHAKYSIVGDGKLVVTTSVVVSQAAAAAGASTVELDLSRLKSFSLDGTRTPSILSVGESAGFNDTGTSSPAGVMQLAETNWLSVTGKLTVGFFNPLHPAPTQPSALYLGRSNEIHTAEVGVGYTNAFQSRLAFNPAFVATRTAGPPPFARFRGPLQSLSPRVSWWIVGANVGRATAASTGLCDFTGGSVDAMIETMRVGRGSSPGSHHVGKGTLIFDDGKIDANVVEIGAQSEYNGGDGVGLIQVNASADGHTKGTLRVNNWIILGQVLGTPSPATSGTLEIHGGSVLANTVLGGGGTSRVVVDHGTLAIDNALGTTQSPIGSLELKQATLRFESPTKSIAVLRTLVTVDGPSRIRFAKFPEIRAFPVTFSILKFANRQGTASLQLEDIPEGFSGHLRVDDAAGTVALVVTDGPIPWWQRWWAKVLLVALVVVVVSATYIVRVRTLLAIRRKLEQQVAERTQALTERSQELQRLNLKLAEAYQLTDAANRELENRVAARTAELQAAIADLQREVGERKRLEQDYRGIFENAVEGIYRATVGGRFLAANPAMARMLGFASPPALIASVTDIAHQLYVDVRQRTEFAERLHADHIVRGFECQMRRQDGAVITVVTNARAEIDAHGHVLYYEGTLEDVTDRKRLEEQFRHAQKVEMIGQLAGGVAHDFNNLLTVINANAGLMLDAGRLTPESRESLEQIQAAGVRAAALTRQLLAFSRKQAPTPSLVDLNQVIVNIAKMLRRLIDESITLDLRLGPGIEPLMADPGMIEQVLVNLAVNARDAMPRGGKLTLSTRIVDVNEAEAVSHGVAPGAFACLAMQDTGVGIPPEIRDQIFEPFFTTKEPGKGTGLGLATVARILQQHRGWIGVESSVGIGTTFSTYWPLRSGPTAPKEKTQAPTAASIRGTETLLLVEDERSVRVTAARGLRSFGYHIIEAADGQQAIDLWRRHRAEIALLITDQIMPGGLTGSELAIALQKDKPDLPVICTSGYSGEGRGEIPGIARHLPKPYDLHLLANLVRDLLDGPRSPLGSPSISLP